MRGNPAQAADILVHGFDDYHQRYRAVTRRARERFERREWQGIRRDTVERLGLYDRSLTETLESLTSLVGPEVADPALLGPTKDAYTEAILGRHDFELAQTFFNSVSRKLVPHVGLDPRIDYLSRDFPLPFRGWEMASARMYGVHRIDARVLCKVLRDAGLRAPFRDLEDDAERLAARIDRALDARFGCSEVESLDVLRPLFFRNKAAYLVARARRGDQVMPVVIALLHEPDGLSVDAVLTTEELVSILFSFARWYFHAEVESPREVIGFLHSLLPRKRVAELYISLGYHKHGKSEFFSDLAGVIESTRERFEVAPGERGLVMSVFTLDSYEFVFKVIKDSFPPEKSTTRERIREKYRQVLFHDRVGRLVDFQEFDNLIFPRERFAEDLLEELLEDCGRTVRPEGDRVVVRHAYVGRRVEPLDLFLRRVSMNGEHGADGQREAVVIDWGDTMKDLAAANIFPGDLLLKNFGVTRHGRVVFYDYDELMPLDECRFRRIPPPRDPHEAMADQPWFSAGENDVFPEEFERFLEFQGRDRELFYAHHADLLGVEFWRSMQELERHGEVIDFFPYPESVRLRPASEPAAVG
ncbi:MAG: bifunctional isocitrate dehydrogenase kinase/phosphatase [Acidobacteriota bacterium]|jgi:isocitrate dehydrogenase kinase/phosphatase